MSHAFRRKLEEGELGPRPWGRWSPSSAAGSFRRSPIAVQGPAPALSAAPSHPLEGAVTWLSPTLAPLAVGSTEQNLL